jgi:DNA repair protein RadC
VFEPAIRNFAAQIAVAHNHPSGSIQPSEEDVAITKKLVDSGKILGIEIIDHVIVAKDNYYSFKAKGLI